MFGRGFNIFAIAGSMVVCVALAGLFASQVQHKPWGVPDFRRAEYEEILKQNQLAQQAAAGQASIPLPELGYPRRTLAIDDVVSGEQIDVKFEINNSGNAPLKLQFESQSNEEMDWNLSSSTLAPEQTATLQIRWTANDKEPYQTGSVELKSNDPRSPKVAFAVYASVKRPLIIPPSVSFGRVDLGTVFSESFYVVSETTDDMSIISLQSDLDGFDYSVEPVEIDQIPEEFRAAKVAYRVTVSGARAKYGAFGESLDLELLLDDELRSRTSELVGQVRSPVSFVHPDVHRTNGLNMGTLSSETEMTIGVGVRQRGESPRSLVVLDHAPKELEVELIPQKSVPGAYQLVMKVREGTPTTIFNRKDKRGFVSVGDPNEPEYSEWLPLYGVIVAE